MKIKNFLFLALLTIGTLSAQAQTLSIGFYDDLEEWDDYGSNLYEGNVWDCVPINLAYTNSGTQIILTKEELAEMAGKNITALRFIPHDGGSCQDIMYNVTVYLSETNRSTFYKNTSPLKYKYFDVSHSVKLFDDILEHDGFTYSYCDCAPIELTFSNPFYYSGDNNLVITIIADEATECTPGLDYFNFYESDLSNRAITFSSDSKTLGEVLADDCYAESHGVSILNAPVCQFSYEEGTPMAAKWFSYVPQSDEDLRIQGFDAYQIKAAPDGVAQLTRVNQAKKNTPLIVCQSVTPSISPADGSLDNVASNLLKVSDGTVHGGDNIYALAEKNGVTAFYRVGSSVTIPQGKVYLEVTGNANEVIFISEDDVTGLASLPYENANTANAWFTLDGRRLNGTPSEKGIYIVNGKKIMK